MPVPSIYAYCGSAGSEPVEARYCAQSARDKFTCVILGKLIDLRIRSFKAGERGFWIK